MTTFARALILALLGSVLAACSGGQAAPPPVQPTAPVAAQPIPPGPGGTLIMTLGGRDPTTIDPALIGDVTSAFVARQIFSGLVRLDDSLAVQPDLAERWEVSADGKTYTFTLRADARFADGTPISSADVLYSFERATDPALGPAPPALTYLSDIVGAREKLAGQADSIAGLSAPDERTLSIVIDAPKSYFLAKLSHPTSHVVDQRAVDAGGADWTDQPNGSGPFTIERWEHDELLVLARNVNYYRDLARLDRVRFLIGAAASNPLVLYEQGEIDVTDVPSYALARAQDESGPLARELVSVPELSLTYIGLNVTLPPFDDPKVRQAFALLIDRARIADVTLPGSVAPARAIMPPGLPGYDPELPLPAPDAAKARQLIAESRYGDPAALPPIAAYGSWAGMLREVVQEALGVTIEVRDYEDYGEYYDALDRGEFQVFGTGWVADYPDPENFVDLLFRGGSGENHSGYANPAVDALLDQAAVETDEARRFELYRQAEQQIVSDAALIPLYHGITHTLIKPYVRGLTVTPMGILDLSTVELVR